MREQHPPTTVRVGIFHPADPAGHIPSGIDTVIRGILKWAPPDIKCTLYGATSDPVARPVDEATPVVLDGKTITFFPIVSADPSSKRGVLPLSLRYLWALRRYQRAGMLHQLDVLDFHRIETAVPFRNDPRPKSMTIHQDMAVIRDPNCDIGWRHAPWLYERLEAALFPRLNRIYSVRQSAVDRYRHLFASIADRFDFMPTWVEPTVFYPASNLTQIQALRKQLATDKGISPTAKLLVSVGRLDRQKDPLLLLDAFASAVNVRADMHLVLVGDGTLRDVVEMRCREPTLLGKVTLMGARPPERVAELMQAADIFVMASAYEGMPIVVLEALATGLPVVTTDVGEVRRVVRTSINGAVVAQRTPAELASAIIEVLQNLATLRGSACVEAVLPYHPQLVLKNIYDNQRKAASSAQ